MTDAELRDAAWAELKQTTVGWVNRKWTVPPAGTHWANAKALLDQIGTAAPTPPASSGKLWGISPSNNGGFNPAIDVQMAQFAAIGINCPRIPGDSAAAASARAHGFKQWIAWITGDGSATDAQVIAYAKANPEARVGIGNELNLNPNWTAAKVAVRQIALYQAVKAAGVTNRVVLPSIGNSPSAAEHLLPLDFSRKLRDAGCVAGKAFDDADYHAYASNPQSYDNWMHIWTPDGSGDSCQSVLGHPPFFVTEFGAKIGKDVVDAAAQAAAATAWVQKLDSLPECAGGMWFQMADGSAWAGYGLIDGAGVHRPAYAAFKAAIAS